MKLWQINEARIKKSDKIVFMKEGEEITKERENEIISLFRNSVGPVADLEGADNIKIRIANAYPTKYFILDMNKPGSQMRKIVLISHDKNGDYWFDRRDAIEGFMLLTGLNEAQMKQSDKVMLPIINGGAFNIRDTPVFINQVKAGLGTMLDISDSAKISFIHIHSKNKNWYCWHSHDLKTGYYIVLTNNGKEKYVPVRETNGDYWVDRRKLVDAYLAISS